MADILKDIRRTAKILEKFGERPADVERWQRAAAEIERLRGEIERPQPVPQWLLDQHNVCLRPCPFCEATEVQLVSFGAEAELDMRYFVQCETCSARGPITLFSQKAVLGWNHARELRDEWECRGQNR